MDGFTKTLGLDQPAEYQVKVQGRLERDLSGWFQGDVCVTYEAISTGTATSLRGRIADQAALHGLLNHIRDLGLVLLFVDCLEK
jgi:hypothetical protein